MGEGDFYVKKMLQKPENFADLFNAKIFEGRQVIPPESLTLMPNESGVVFVDGKRRKRTLQRRRDVVMKTSSGVYLAVLACEIQANIHYAMPVRTMLYDALNYTDQIQMLEQEHQCKKDLKSGEEFLSGIKKSDILQPVVTIVFYYGKREWDGSLNLYGMMGMAEDKIAKELLKYVPDYRINLVNAADEENLERYRSDLHYVLGMLKYNKNKQELYRYAHDNRTHLRSMDDDSISAMLVMMGEQERVMKIMESSQEKGEMDMCQAIDELIEDGRVEGKIEGENLLAALMQRLFHDGRLEDARLAADDEGIRRMFYKEYGLAKQ